MTDLDCASALASVRALGRAGFVVHGVGEGSRPPARLSRFLQSYRQVPSPWNQPHNFIQCISEISSILNPEVILPMSEGSINCFSALAKDSNVAQRILVACHELQFLGMSKIAAFERAVERQLPVAPGFVLGSSDQSFLNLDLGWPRVVRTDNFLDSQNCYQKGKTWIVYSQADMDAIRLEVSSRECRFLIQKYIDGFGCGAFFLLWRGEVICWHSHVRLAEIPWRGGVSARRRIDANEDLFAIATKLFEGTQATGLVMVEFRAENSRHHGKLHNYHLVEVNSRPWGSMSLALHANLPFVPAWVDLYLSRVKGFSTHPQVNETYHLRCDGFVCTSIFPGEVQHLLSVFRSWKRCEIGFFKTLGFFLESVRCVMSPKTRFDFFVVYDYRPSLMQMRILVSLIFRYLGKFVIHFLVLLFYLAHKNLRQKSQFDLFVRTRKIKNLLIVCYGNRCRSPFLAGALSFIIRDREIKLSSKGLCVLESWVPDRFHGIFRAHGIEPRHHNAMPISEIDVNLSECIVLMERKHFFEFFLQFGWKALQKCHLPIDKEGREIQIHDPYLVDTKEASLIFAQLQECAMSIGNLLNE